MTNSLAGAIRHSRLSARRQLFIKKVSGETTASQLLKRQQQRVHRLLVTSWHPLLTCRRPRRRGACRHCWTPRHSRIRSGLGSSGELIDYAMAGLKAGNLYWNPIDKLQIIQSCRSISFENFVFISVAEPLFFVGTTNYQFFKTN